MNTPPPLPYEKKPRKPGKYALERMEPDGTIVQMNAEVRGRVTARAHVTEHRCKGNFRTILILDEFASKEKVETVKSVELT